MPLRLPDSQLLAHDESSVDVDAIRTRCFDPDA
ncbi:hypothetical protein OKW40_004710 [Paraburkholderia sp. RAU6.4a]